MEKSCWKKSPLDFWKGPYKYMKVNIYTHWGDLSSFQWIFTVNLRSSLTAICQLLTEDKIFFTVDKSWSVHLVLLLKIWQFSSSQYSCYGWISLGPITGLLYLILFIIIIIWEQLYSQPDLAWLSLAGSGFGNIHNCTPSKEFRRGKIGNLCIFFNFHIHFLKK